MGSAWENFWETVWDDGIKPIFGMGGDDTEASYAEHQRLLEENAGRIADYREGLPGMYRDRIDATEASFAPLFGLAGKLAPSTAGDYAGMWDAARDAIPTQSDLRGVLPEEEAEEAPVPPEDNFATWQDELIAQRQGAAPYDPDLPTTFNDRSEQLLMEKWRDKYGVA